MTIVAKENSNFAALLEESQARFKTVDRPIPKPGPNEIVVRNHASMYSL